MADTPTSFDEYLELFAAHGGTDTRYSRDHFQRYVQTKRRVLANWDRSRGNRLLDIGAHWLHQAILYAIDGFEVTALDLPDTFELPNVRALAQAHAMRLLPSSDLEHATALREIADNSFDLVLFTEIIEHITFNPVMMWREIYRVMKPGARIIITTPNHYALRARARRLLRLCRGLGGGLDVTDLLNHHTYAHHWKEYALRELITYFQVLSPDFICVDRAYIEKYNTGCANKRRDRFVRWVEHIVPTMRTGLFVSVQLQQKDKGIVVQPHW